MSKQRTNQQNIKKQSQKQKKKINTINLLKRALIYNFKSLALLCIFFKNPQAKKERY